MIWRHRALQWVERSQVDFIDEVVNVAEIPAPSLDEGERTTHVTKRLRELGWTDVVVDAIGNVSLTVSGERGGPHVMFAAHLDTVFDRKSHRAPRRDGNILHGPGVWDNSASVASLISLARLFKVHPPQFPGKVTLAFPVGEEGLGNLKGMHALMNRQDVPDVVIALDGLPGRVVTTGIASVRYEVTVETEGGHSWSSYGNENAIELAAQCIGDMCSLELPEKPKTTRNIGTIHGGSSINAIARQAVFTVELRSESEDELNDYDARLLDILSRYRRHIKGEITHRVIGKRPGGSISNDHYILDVVRRVHGELNLTTTYVAASTDANVPLSMGIPAITLGVAQGANAHRPDEYLHVDSIPVGMKQHLLVLDEIWK